MNRLQSVAMVFPEASTLRAWEDMRIEILHEIQDGGTVLDELVDIASDLATLVNPWSLAKPPVTHIARIHVN